MLGHGYIGRFASTLLALVGSPVASGSRPTCHRSAVLAVPVFQPGTELIYRTTPVIVAVYLLVRGLDNIGEDLPPRWRELWPRLFGPISRSSG